LAARSKVGRLNDDTGLDRRLAEYNKKIADLSKQVPKINKYSRPK